ncbi:MAG: sensor histidine kinase [Thermomicrobiales bacterium]
MSRTWRKNPRQIWAEAVARARGDGSVDAWERWFPWWNVALYGLLLLSVLSTVLDWWASESPAAWRWLAMAGLSLAFGTWHWQMVIRRTEDIQRARPMLVYLGGATLLYVGLTELHPAFMTLTFVMYLNLFSLVPTRWSLTIVGPFSLVVWWRGAASGDDGGIAFTPETAAIFLISLALSGGMALYIDAIIRQSSERGQLIDELHATRGQLAAAQWQAGRTAERQRLAGEIHDTLAQGFASIVMNLEAADGALKGGTPDLPTVERHLDQARRTARESLTEARHLVWALRPAPLEQDGLHEALKRLAARWSEESGVGLVTAVHGAPRTLHPEVEVTLLRAAQEALANVRKHAGATRVTLTLSYMEDEASLDIQDDGGGFDPAARNGANSTQDGYGLAAMRARVEGLGGTLSVESAPGQGTTIAAAVPALTVAAVEEKGA